jgi:peptidyl-prolyl cis-trans isomerase B (cyclophilin B)
VSYCWKTAFVCLTLFAWTPLMGCNHGSEGGGPPTVAMNDPAQERVPADQPSPRKPSSDPRHPVILIETSQGSFSVELNRDKAPLTVDNFLAYVRASFYDGTIVHQVYKGQCIVGGGYDTSGAAKSARTPIRNEAAENGLKNRRGTIAMVRLPGATDSATSQFLINVADNPTLDFRDRTPEGYGYCVFGEVIEGMDVVNKINQAAVHDTADLDRTPTQRIVVKSIRRIR